jgi:hypothetical protein
VNHKSGAEVPETGVYWCTVCKKPARFEKGKLFPECKNLCGRGYWQLVKAGEKPDGSS